MSVKYKYLVVFLFCLNGINSQHDDNDDDDYDDNLNRRFYQGPGNTISPHYNILSKAYNKNAQCFMAFEQHKQLMVSNINDPCQHQQHVITITALNDIIQYTSPMINKMYQILNGAVDAQQMNEIKADMYNIVTYVTSKTKTATYDLNGLNVQIPGCYMDTQNLLFKLLTYPLSCLTESYNCLIYNTC